MQKIECNRITKETRYKRENGIEEPVYNDNDKPILTSVWLPSKDQLKEYFKVPFYKAITFTGRTFPFVVRNLLGLYSNKDDLIYDPMIGSGTTLYEAIKMGRRVMGSDLNMQTVENFKSRWREYCSEIQMPEVRASNAEALNHIDSNSINLIITSFPWYQNWSFYDKTKSVSAQKSMEKKQKYGIFYKSIYRNI